jgi:tetratricopeptide (TPR) repeat protein
MRHPRRALLACVLALCACSTPGPKNQLGLYLENAANYYDSGHYLRAYQQWEQALLVDEGNDKARLGQAWALYQIGRAEDKDALGPLGEAEKRFDELRRESLGGQHWKAELGYALVQQRWLELYDRKVRRLRFTAQSGAPADPAEMATAKAEFDRRLLLAESSYRGVLGGSEREPTDQLTCWLGLAQIQAWRGDLPDALEYANKYLTVVERSKKLWTDAIERFPRDAPIYEAKLKGAKSQEAELRDLMGNVLFKLGKPAEAEAELDKVIAIDPKRAATYLNRGVIRHDRGDWDLARSDLRRFLTLSPLPEGDAVVVEAARRLAECERMLAASEAAPPGR